MHKNTNVYAVESSKSVSGFVKDFAAVVKANNYVINNTATMDMKKTFAEHGGNVPEDFDMHMIHICKPTKADKSLTANPERAILMPKFVHVFSQNGTTQIRYLSYAQEEIEALVPEDPKFSKSLAGTYSTIHSMIDEAR